MSTAPDPLSSLADLYAEGQAIAGNVNSSPLVNTPGLAPASGIRQSRQSSAGTAGGASGPRPRRTSNQPRPVRGPTQAGSQAAAPNPSPIVATAPTPAAASLPPLPAYVRAGPNRFRLGATAVIGLFAVAMVLIAVSHKQTPSDTAPPRQPTSEPAAPSPPPTTQPKAPTTAPAATQPQPTSPSATAATQSQTPPQSAATAATPSEPSSQPRPAPAEQQAALPPRPPEPQPSTQWKGRYRLSYCGSVVDSQSGLQWYISPDVNTTWPDAVQWTRQLDKCGGGWQAPSTTQLQALFDRSASAGTGYYTDGRYFPAHLDPIFAGIGRGSWVWASGLAGSTSEPAFNFNQGIVVQLDHLETSFSVRAFAVKPGPLRGRVTFVNNVGNFAVDNQFIKLYGILVPGTRVLSDTQAVLAYIKDSNGYVECVTRGETTHQCFADGRDIALLALRDGLVRPANDAPSEYRAATPMAPAKR